MGGCVRRRRGFTLVELLVVIAVIMMLAALLLPVVQRGAMLARRVRCTSNVGQIVKAIASYGVSFDSEMPDLMAHSRTTEMYRVSYLARIYYEGKIAVGLGILLARGYVADPQSLVCPHATMASQYDTPINPAWEGLPMRTAYMYNYFPPKGTPSAHGDIAPPEGVAAEQVENRVPGRRPPCFDAIVADTFHGYPHAHSMRDGINAGYTDGAAKWLHITFDEFAYDEIFGAPHKTSTARFSYSADGYARTRDVWVTLSNKRK